MPDHVVYRNRAVHKDDVPEDDVPDLRTKNGQVPRRKRGYRNMKKVASKSMREKVPSKSTEEKVASKSTGKKGS